MTTAAPDTRSLTICDECGQPYLLAHTAQGQRPIKLAPEPVTRGLYELDEHGRAVRRGLVELYTAAREHREWLGLDLHDCTPVQWWDRD